LLARLFLFGALLLLDQIFEAVSSGSKASMKAA
jgi:hypothetical protein